ncbi:MAG: EamA/RhaT family transporter [Bacteroidetes bacterium]|nr:EamA/RhaT family transporter [Bacteroidota bacterium]
MIYLILSILFSVLLLVNFRIFPKYGINTAQAIALNYPVCFISGYLLMPAGQTFSMPLAENWVWFSLLLGFGFIITFILSGASTQKIGMTITSLANNISLVIPVLFSLLVFNTSEIQFSGLNYFGLILAILAIGIATFKGGENGPQKANWLTTGGLALAVFLMYGITNTAINFLNIKYIADPSRTIPVTLVMIFGAILGGIFLLLYNYFVKKEKLEFKNLIAAITLGIPNFLSFYFLILTLGHFGNSGAFVYPVYNIGVISVSALVSIIYFKEKISKLNSVGIGLAILAIALISWEKLF